jgi:RNA polymerase sigma-70 factor (ECF subfamily)
VATQQRGAAFSTPRRSTLRAVDRDVEMVARLRNGDEEAFVNLVSRYQQPMLRLARSFVPSQAVAEEAVQDTWLGLVRGLENFEGRSSFKTWLFRILVNRARSAGTKEHAAAPTESLHAVDPARFNAEGPWADPVEGLSHDEACSVLGISVGNQRVLLHRGRSQLRGILETKMGKG